MNIFKDPVLYMGLLVLIILVIFGITLNKIERNMLTICSDKNGVIVDGYCLPKTILINTGE